MTTTSNTNNLSSIIERLYQNDTSLTYLIFPYLEMVHSITLEREEDFDQLLLALECNSVMKIINMKGCSLGETPTRLIKFANMMQRNSSLTKLDLSSNFIDNEGCSILAHALQGHETLQKLNLSVNSIGPQGCQALAETVLNAKYNKALTKLTLHYNKKINEKSCKWLAEALMEPEKETNDATNHGHIVSAAMNNKKTTTRRTNNQRLTELNLYNCRIGDLGCMELANMLPKNTTLTKLDIGNNCIGRKGLQALLEGVKRNFSLLHCNVGELNNFDRYNSKDPGTILCQQIMLLLQLNEKKRREIFVMTHTYTPKQCVQVLIDLVEDENNSNKVEDRKKNGDTSSPIGSRRRDRRRVERSGATSSRSKTSSSSGRAGGASNKTRDGNFSTVQLFFSLLSIRPELCDVGS